MSALLELAQLAKTYGCEVRAIFEPTRHGMVTMSFGVFEHPDQHELVGMAITPFSDDDLSRAARDLVFRLRNVLVETSMAPGGVIDENHVHPWLAVREKG